MYAFKKLIGEEVKVEISGNTTFSGILIDIGLDVLVIYNGSRYLYIPLIHMHNIKDKKGEFAAEEATEKPHGTMPFQTENEVISYRKILLNAKGQFVEIFITGNKSLHGYITNVLNDYFVFYSPVFKTTFISMQHLKWLTPYTTDLTPYTLSTALLPVMPSTRPLSRTFEEQIKKFVGQLLVFDMGDHANKVGLLSDIADNFVELVNAEGHSAYWKISHLKTANTP